MLEIDEDGNRCWYDEKHQLHRIGGPAVEYINGTKCWAVNGKRHRGDGPAIERHNGEMHWYVNGKLHRIDGPAIETVNGTKMWYLNGKSYTEAKYKKKVG
jgi:hypothetical protein